MHTVTLAANKGGVGKTSVTGEVAALLGARGHRVLAVDCDPQGMLAITIAGHAVSPDRSVGRTLGTEVPLSDIIERDVLPGVDLAGSQRSTTDEASVRMAANQLDGMHWLAEKLRDVADDYDYCLIDTPPGMGPLVTAALVAADSLVIPMPAEPMVLVGAFDIMHTATRIVRRANPSLRLLGVLLHAYDPRLLVSRSVVARLEGNDPPIPVLKTTIPKSTRAAVASGQGIPVSLGFPEEKVSHAYQALTDELLELTAQPTTA